MSTWNWKQYLNSNSKMVDWPFTGSRLGSVRNRKVAWMASLQQLGASKSSLCWVFSLAVRGRAGPHNGNSQLSLSNKHVWSSSWCFRKEINRDQVQSSRFCRRFTGAAGLSLLVGQQCCKRFSHGFRRQRSDPKWCFLQQQNQIIVSHNVADIKP